MTRADIIASVTDPEIEALLAEREQIRRRRKRLQDQIDNLESEIGESGNELRDCQAKINAWCEEVRSELESNIAER